MKKISFHTVTSFLLTLTLCLLLVFIMISNRSRVERLTMEQLITEKSIKINGEMTRLLYKTQVLSAMIIQNEGEVENFKQLAATIVDSPAILNILIAPDGVVSDVYPLEGNESVIGLDFFSEGAGNKEAVMAKETEQLVLGGPFDAVQGGQILVGRTPVFINDPEEGRRFWGLVSVTLRYPQALDGAGLKELNTQGFAYEMWRINPDNNERQIISDSGHKYSRYTNYIEKHIPILNSDWYFRVLPVRVWYDFPETWMAFLISIFVSIMVAAVTQNNQDLKRLKDEMEILSNTDSLTGIYNRRYFMDSIINQMDMVVRTEKESFIILFDMDYFKNVNDNHGHQAGDTVLKEISARVAGVLRSYDLFARYGGEEFIIFTIDIDAESATGLAERIREVILKTPIEAEGIHIPVTASFGVARAAPCNKLEMALALADKALYTAKEEGRNKVVFQEEESALHKA